MSPSSSLDCGFATFVICFGVAMTSVGDLPLPTPVQEVGPESWSSSAALCRLVWAIKRHYLSPAAPRAARGRAALALWISGLYLRDFREIGPPGASSDDEGMLD